jgi:hypothetical protein
LRGLSSNPCLARICKEPQHILIRGLIRTPTPVILAGAPRFRVEPEPPSPPGSLGRVRSDNAGRWGFRCGLPQMLAVEEPLSTFSICPFRHTKAGVPTPARLRPHLACPVFIEPRWRSRCGSASWPASSNLGRLARRMKNRRRAAHRIPMRTPLGLVLNRVSDERWLARSLLPAPRILQGSLNTTSLDDRRPRNNGNEVPWAFHAHQTEVQLHTAAAS